jgi:hypothetical protein
MWVKIATLRAGGSQVFATGVASAMLAARSPTLPTNHQNAREIFTTRKSVTSNVLRQHSGLVRELCPKILIHIQNVLGFPQRSALPTWPTRAANGHRNGVALIKMLDVLEQLPTMDRQRTSAVAD